VRKSIYLLFCLSYMMPLKAQHPDIGGYNVYYGILHNHTTVSDGTGTDDEAYNYAKNIAGLDFFSTANHETYIVEAEWAAIKAAADKYNEDGVFTTFRGFEISISGHVTVINTDDYPSISEDPSGNLVELSAWLEARNGLAFFNHPNRGEGKVFGGFASAPCYKFVGMELFNGRDDYSMHYYNDGYWPDDGGLNHFSEANSRGWKIGASGSDDNHAGTWGTRTDYRLAILSEHLTRAELFAAMEARRFYSTLDKNLALSFKLDTNEMGSTVEGGDYDVQIQAMDMDDESFTRVMLFRNGIEMNTWDIDTQAVDLTLPLTAFSDEFYYVKVTQADGDEAVSSPVFITGGMYNSAPTCSVTAPENGIHFDIPQSVTIVADASDADGSVVLVEFFVNGDSVGSDTTAPYSMEYMVPDNGSYEITARATDENGAWTNSSPVAFTTGVFSQSVSRRIASGTDDVEENEDGSMYTNSSDIELVYDGGEQTIGLRFTGMNIPPGSAIDSAFIQFTVDEASTGACVLSIKGDNADDSRFFSSASKNVSDRATTSAEVTWEPAIWPTVGAVGADQRTPDLSSIIQEIVNRPGYSLSSAITMIITGTGERVAEAYEGVAASAALLTVHYSFGEESNTSIPALFESRVRIFPNPVTNGKVTIALDGETVIKASVTIVDALGRICHQLELENAITELDISDIKSGLYMINLTRTNTSSTYKLIIQ